MGAKARKPGHCWHATGMATTWLTGGEEQVRCCHCPEYGIRPYRTVRHPLPGHGPYAVIENRIVEAVRCQNARCAAPPEPGA